MTKHRALVTAPFRGPGPRHPPRVRRRRARPVDRPPARCASTTPTQLAARIDGRRRRPAHRRGRQREGPGARPAARGHRLDPGRPHQRRRRRRHRQGHPGAAGAGAQRRRGGRDDRRPAASPSTRGIVPADRDVREGEVYRDGTIPYQRFRAGSSPARPWASSGSARWAGPRRGASRASACSVISYDPYAPDATHSLDDLLAEADVVSMHAAVTPETEGMIGADAVRPRCARARSTSTPPGRCCTTPTRSPTSLADPATSAAPGSTTSTASTSPPTTRCARWRTWCSRPTSAAPPTTPRPTTRRSSPTTSRACCDGEHARRTSSTRRCCQ